MRVLENLEIHVAHGCNLACESCSHYSNQGHKGLLSIKEGEDWMRRWNRRLKPHVFSLLGGEPTLHPQLCDWLVSAREHWPDAHLRLVSNGLLLHRFPELPKTLRRIDAHLYVSVHHDSAEYREKLAPVRELIDGWIARHGIAVTFYDSYRNWTRRYHGHGASMRPFTDGRPRESWAICPARCCRQLFQGALWKCSPLAYLRLQEAKYGLSEEWRPYLAYEPLAHTCTDAELDAFLGLQAESYCSMCPAFPRRIEPASPLHRHKPRASAARHRHALRIIAPEADSCEVAP